MKKQRVKDRKVLRWVVVGLFCVLVNFIWMTDLQAAGVVGNWNPG